MLHFKLNIAVCGIFMSGGLFLSTRKNAILRKVDKYNCILNCYVNNWIQHVRKKLQHFLKLVLANAARNAIFSSLLLLKLLCFYQQRF